MTFAVVQYKTIDIRDEITIKQSAEVSNIVQNEIEMAQSVLGGYKKEFWIPDYINGEEYTIELIDQAELIISFKDKKHIAFLVTEVQGSISPEKGYHIITKDDAEEITIGQGRI
jgi:hypothetical protein|tara:strand:+ start:253 stop:594 length:342 start_codon:yes stop_codon:yes gene_type:complete